MLTLVTAFFDLAKREASSRRTADDYIKHGKYILSLPHNLVVFIDPEFYWIVWEERKKHNLLHKTAIYPIRLEDLPYYQLRERMIIARTKNPTHNGSTIKDTANYMITMWSKFYFMQMITEKNPFNTTHFGWIDFGLTHVANIKYVDHAFENIPEQFKILILKWFTRDELNDPSYFLMNRGNIACGYFTASRDVMLKVCSSFRDQAISILDKGFAPTDEQILPFLIDCNPDLFTFYYGDYDGILSNYKIQHISMPTTLLNLTYCCNKKEFTMGVDIGERVYSSYCNGTLECRPDELKTFMNLYHLCLKDSGKDITKLIEPTEYIDLLFNNKDYEQVLYQINTLKTNLWYKFYMKGRVLEEQGSWNLALSSYLEAYQHDTDKAEPLYQISRHYRIGGQCQLGYMFAQKALSCKDSTLHHKIKEEISICAYYTKDRHIGYKVSDELDLNRKTESSVRNMVRSNMFFYIPLLHPQSITLDIELPQLSSTHKYNPLNPSIIPWKEGYLVNCRCVNYEKKGDPLHIMDSSGCIITRNILCEYDSKWNKRRQWEIIDDLKGLVHGNVIGLEDLRLFEWKSPMKEAEWKSEVWFTATCWMTGAVPQMVLCQLDSELVHVRRKYLLIGPNGEFHHEKNWLPYIQDDILYIIYSHEPYIILKIPSIPESNTGKIQCDIYHQSSHKHYFGAFKGSCSPIPIGDAYLGLVHETIQRERRYYLERFVWYDKDSHIKKVSLPFNFLHHGIEFNCGMCFNGTDIIIGWGKEDSSVGLVQIPISTVSKLLYELE